ncbi:MAG: peroxidase, partial [Candidatus Eremiobacteraeota bacterium]|nr:peroxidase [Candidatus Eremiobacteraeota bacterium]
LAGDRRANENLALTSLQTLFMREHNRVAKDLATRYPEASDEELYQGARKVVGAQIQKITFDEFLPSLMGEDAMPAYQGYQPETDASINNIFASAAFRMGHSQVGRAIRRIEENGDETEYGHLCLRAGFHQAPRLVNEGGVEPILRGLSEYLQENTDTKVVDDLRNFLFGRPGQGGLDLASVNIQRGRDHGLPSFNKVREGYGMPALESFSQLTDEPKVVEALESVYQSPAELDPWVGFLAEQHEAGSSIGPTLKKVLVDQFSRIRDGDRFFYQNDPDVKMLAPDIENTRLVDIIKRNTGIENIQDDLFIARDGDPFDDPCRS